MAAFGRLGALGRGFGRLGGGGKSAGDPVIPGVITARAGSYNVTGYDAGLLYGRAPLVAALGTYAVSGVAANFPRTYVLTAAAGSHVVTGVDAALTYGVASTNFTAVRISHLQW